MRLDRLLANLGYGSRREVGWLFDRQRVTRLDGTPVTIGDKATHAELLVDGQPLDPPAPLVLLMNKAADSTCSHTNDEGPTVYESLPHRFTQRQPALSTVGRLDKDTTGLLVLTDDGQLLHRLISPKKIIWKTYLAHLDRPLQGNEAEIFAAGTLMLNSETKPCLPARLRVIQAGDKPIVEVDLSEGRYHQVRRMFAAVGNHVLTLHRSKVGALALPSDLALGQWRVASEVEIVALQQTE